MMQIWIMRGGDGTLHWDSMSKSCEEPKNSEVTRINRIVGRYPVPVRELGYREK